MMQSRSMECDSEVWQAVCTVARYSNNEDSFPLNQGAITAALEEHGFSKDTINQTLVWLGRVAASGELYSVFAMLQPQWKGVRIFHPAETIKVHPKLLRVILHYRRSGLVSDEVAEQLIEMVRTVDTRELEPQRVNALLQELLTQVIPGQKLEGLESFFLGLSSS